MENNNTKEFEISRFHVFIYPPVSDFWHLDFTINSLQSIETLDSNWNVYFFKNRICTWKLNLHYWDKHYISLTLFVSIKQYPANIKKQLQQNSKSTKESFPHKTLCVK